MIEFDWDEWNVDHIARHNVDPEEAEQVLSERPYIRRSRDQRYVAYGQTEDGRYLAVVFARRGGHRLRVVTARDMTDSERSEYRRHRA